MVQEEDGTADLRLYNMKCWLSRFLGYWKTSTSYDANSNWATMCYVGSYLWKKKKKIDHICELSWQWKAGLKIFNKY